MPSLEVAAEPSCCPSRRLAATSEPLNRYRAGHRLATQAMSLDPVLEDELHPRRERHHAARDQGRAAAVQPGDKADDLIHLNRRAPLGQRCLARDGLKRQRAQRCVFTPHERYPPRGLPPSKRLRLRHPKLRFGRELENSGATVGATAANHERAMAAPNGVTDDQLPALRQLSEEFG